MSEQEIRDMVAKNIRELRARRGWSQPQAAEAIGVALATYRVWEQCVKFPSPAGLALIATAFRVPVGRLFRA